MDNHQIIKTALDNIIERKIGTMMEGISSTVSQWYKSEANIRCREMRENIENEKSRNQFWTYDSNHALVKKYEAYLGIFDHVNLIPIIDKADNGGSVSFSITTDGWELDDYRKDRLYEIIENVIRKIKGNYLNGLLAI